MNTNLELKELHEIYARLDIIWRMNEDDRLDHLWLFFYSAPWRYEGALVIEAIAHWLIQNEHLPAKTAWLFNTAKRCPEGERSVGLARELAICIKEGLKA
ncbi:MAG: hypothetical protein AAFX78_10195 [Cyanobacteria bacterium J06638_20]